MTSRLSIILLSVIALINFSACNTDKHRDKLIEGDLYFDWLRFGSFYNKPDSVVKQVKLYADTVNREMLYSDNLKFLTRYEILKKKDLLYRPFIDLKLDTDSIVKIYFINNDYDKIKIYKRHDLLDTKKKIRLKAEVQDLGFGMALEKKLISINKVDGQTFQINPKLKIEDYR